MNSRPKIQNSIAALLIVFGGLTFLPSLGAYFLSDDFVLLGWTRDAPAGDVLGFFSPATEWFYRPLVKTYFWAGQSLFGMSGTLFHVLSIALHMANAYLLYRLVARHKVVPWGAALLVALLFLLNPRHAETVSWIASVGDLGATSCILGSLLLFGRFLEGGRRLWLVASLALFVAGLLTRESAALLPALLVLYVTALYPQARSRRAAWNVAVYFAVLLAYVGLLWLGREGQPALARGGLQFRALNLDSVLLGVLDYVHGLVPGGTFVASLGLDTLRWLVWVEAAALMALGVLFWRAGRRIALLGLGWLLVSPLVFVPFSGPTDRYFYLPSIGYALIVGDLLGGLPNLIRDIEIRQAVKRTAAALAAVVLVISALSLYSRNLLWHEAGRVSGGVLNDTRRALPNPADYERIHFAGVPTHLNGVPLFQNGLQEAVQLIYNNPTLSAANVTCDSPAVPPNTAILRFKGDGVERLSRDEVCP